MKKIIIITGSKGSIGSELVSLFCELNWEIIQFDPRKESFPNVKFDALILAHGGDRFFFKKRNL